MKNKLFLLLLSSFFSSNLSAMYSENSENQIGFPRPRNLSESKITESDWESLGSFYQQGLEDPRVTSNFSPEQHQFILEKFNNFRHDFESLFRLPKSTSRLNIIRETKDVVKAYASLLKFMYLAFENIIVRNAGAP